MSLTELRDLFLSGKLAKPEFIERSHSEYLRLQELVERTDRTEVDEIRITSQGVCFRFGRDGFWLWAPLDEPRAAPLEALNFGSYEDEIVWVYSLLLDSVNQIWDIGANIGWYTLWFAYQSDSVRVQAFEPVPKNFSYLSRNVAASSVAERIRTYNYGLSDRPSVAELFVYPKGGTNASLVNVSSNSDARPIQAFMHTIDDWSDAFNEVPDLIKIDIEGAELLALKGGIKVLSTHRPIVVAEMLRKWFEPFGSHPNDAIKYMNNIGYSCFGISRSILREIEFVTDQTIETNYLFLHREKHHSIIQLIEEIHQNQA